MGWSCTIVVGGTEIPVWPSWIAVVFTGILSWLGFTASRT